MTNAWEKAWADVQSLRPIIEDAKQEAELLRRLPEKVAHAFIERDVYRLMLPKDFGGAGLDPIQVFDLTLEVSRSDASAAWNYSLAGINGILAGLLPPDQAREMFAVPECGGAGAGAPPGRAVPAEGGYRVTGRWAWASGIHQARRVGAPCLIFDGDKPRMGAHGGPVVIQVLVPIEEVEVLDTWYTGGMRGTGSTEFKITDVFVPEARTIQLFATKPTHPDPIFKLPTSFFGFPLSAVPLGVAFSTIEKLKEMALTKKLPPPRSTLAEQASLQYTVAKAQAMVEAVLLALRDSCTRMWNEVKAQGEATMESRARLRRAMVHAVDTGIEAVSMCYRMAGGSAVFESAPFERALRDVYVVGGHAVFQRAMMEDAGRVELGLKPFLGMF